MILAPFVVSAADDRLAGWAGSVGLNPYSAVSALDPSNLANWVRGYWTGVNLYLGGTDLCEARRNFSSLSKKEIVTMVDIHCGALGESEIMFAAFNALKGLPELPGSRAAACEGK